MNPLYNKSKKSKLNLENDPDEVYQCHICDAIFKKMCHLKHHWDSIHEENDSHQKKLLLDSPVKLHCHECQEKLGDFNQAINHQTKNHDVEKFTSTQMKEISYFVDDASVYEDDIELEDIRLYIVAGANFKRVVQLGIYKFQNREDFKKYLDIHNMKSNFTV